MKLLVNCDGLYTAVHSVTSLLPAAPTSTRSVPPLLSDFPHHARTAIKGKLKSRIEQFTRDGELGNTGASHWTDVKEMPLLIGSPIGGYLQYRPD